MINTRKIVPSLKVNNLTELQKRKNYVGDKNLKGLETMKSELLMK